MEQLADLKNLTDFKSLLIILASPEQIRAWSRGEVTKPETINYRTLKPEKDGLFDERIFGPTKDWECYCGKYKRIRYKGVICDKCGVEVTESRVRRERMGHITLATPVAHVWFFKGAPSKISLLLGVAPRGVEQVIYFARYLITDVDEEGRKVAVKNIQEAKDVSLGEIADNFKSRRDSLRVEENEAKAKVTTKIKNKEQASLALAEIELNLRKKEAALSEEEKSTVSRTNELFDNLMIIIKGLRPLSILSEEEFDELYDHQATDFFTAKMGADAVLEAVSKINLEEISKSLREEITSTKGGSSKYIKIVKRLKLIDGLRRAKVNPGWMVLRVLPVLPPDLRPMVQLSGGRFATSDLNDLYRRVINRNNRLKHLIGLGAPEIILRNEKRMLQEAVDSLIDASQRKATRKSRGRQPLRSLSDMLRGKQGRFRQNLLGKRVDYSGRSVIIVGPELKLTQCGLPKDMALEMFKPFVLREMIARGIAPNVKSAKNMLDRRPPEVFDILEEITKDHPVLLNRAPTLHKLSIQSFYPVLIEGSAIRLHPAVCSGFNADFDGDQMAVHVPLSDKAVEEARTLMLPTNNLLKPSDGGPAATPSSKEIALGAFYLTSIDTRLEMYPTIFSDKEEAIFAQQTGKLGIRQNIKVRIGKNIIETTVGRLLFNEVLPENFDFINESVTSSVIKSLFVKAYEAVSRERVTQLVDDVKDFGFFGGTISGISFGIFDAKVYPGKAKVLEEADKKVSEIEENFNQGLITAEEKRRLTQEVWIDVSEDLADKTWNEMEPTNPIRVVIDAKVGRASRDQVKQLAAIRGLVVDPMGKIVELPIKSNFREGLSVFEYVTSSRGSRKGLTDTAIKTADAGYLTRRLVDVAHDLIVRLDDCGTKDGQEIRKDLRPQSFASRIFGRFAAKDIVGKDGKTVIIPSGEMIDQEAAKKIDESGIISISVRSPLTCQARHGICAKCYGWDLGTKSLVEIGMPVGVVAAQSIGEPGTQLTLRTKHAAGVVGVDVTQGLPRVEELVEARLPKVVSALSEITGKARISETDEGWKVTITSKGTPKEEKEYIIPKTLELAIEDGELVDAGRALAKGALDIKDILSIKGLRPAQEYIVNEIQKVYESQGIPINDKHVEVIVRKMSDEVRIVTTGDTPFLPGELTSRANFDEENEKVLAAGGEPASAQQVVLGITRRALYTDSWLSAASFEQTTDVLTEASLLGREDHLIGLKENVIIGRLIPVSPDRARMSQG
ncbi:MAG: DNA-directed RNA polymerase beta chain (RNAP beta subunit) [Microgenomates group bacterium GW2011_GWC1_41_20]|uniref:DNA-directed RNA polymerase subunit beta' n=5 Tax=Candidatus Woeseibacteriota TaxID=1752722 RepID=A0A0G0RUG2_9BACT|nr:MAG: DNA-directed RNA polymerase subunit beta' [Candidatus Woesebacteria bacterium GW2011_GWF1_40_24]KKR91016.1 MAG: DNA-directed RNA polymerase subunit beta' [Candidatus Woesebacteria bacterium GW2011_GWD1_41_12]KKS00762.1 MAG: DNA-directed RNA polymerase beta chain (RNAP beta subunit) [Microgenomates group bacterium GW2011_GWC1_41_20]OGM81308.1 MAG: DNA-directed RNA polymerase subunit beta' [Candidatus Woesebacteria bacterium RIFOXYB1_FULL_41_13]OGM83843.1 MAG: DNA-directed RNA polymerase 